MYNLQLRWILLALVAGLLFRQDANAQVFTLRDTFCSNQLIIVNGHLYGPDMPEGTEVLPGAASNGADSIIEVRLVFYKPAVVKLEQIVCANDTIWVNNVPYHAGFTIGEEVIEGGAANGCDSIIQVKLTPAPIAFQEIKGVLCPDSFVIVNGKRYDRNNLSGLETIPNATVNGCDSVIQISLEYEDLFLSIGDDRDLRAGDSACIAPSLNFQPLALEWEPPLPCSDLDCLPVCLPFFATTNLVLHATAPNGCVLSDALTIRIDPTVPYYAPTVFNPDAGWPNNRFFLSAGAGIIRIKSFRIADRWGSLILDREDIMPDNPAEGWDGQWQGKTAAPGVYVFWAELEWQDGSSEMVSGSFALIR